MKLGKATELVIKKAAAVLKSKTGVVLGARILVLASFRRRMAAVGGISHRMQALVAEAVAADREKASRARVDCHRSLVVVPRKTTVAAAAMGEKPAAVDISRQLALFDLQEDGGDGGGCHDRAHALFNDDDDDGDCCYAADEYEVGDDGGGHDDDRRVLLLDDEPPVMEVIRSNREVEGLEFNVDDEIDQAADMFIRRFRERMNRSF